MILSGIWRECLLMSMEGAIPLMIALHKLIIYDDACKS